MIISGLDPTLRAIIQKELAQYERVADPQLQRKLQVPVAFEPRESNGCLSGTSEPPAAPVQRKPRRRKRPARLNYHGIRCAICKHPDREAIEHDFLHWISAPDIAKEFGLGHCRGIYRHAHALGLFKQRAGQLRHRLGLIIEHAANVTPTANDIIRAVRACSCLDEDGHWHEPTRRVIITHQNLPPGPSAGPQKPKSRFERVTK
jgi:hypothetical protein